MKLPFKFKSNPQAFKVSLIITLTVFILNFITHQLFSTNTDQENKSLFTSILYFLILFIIVRITVKFYIRKQINIGVSKILSELNPEILRDFTEDKNLEIITDKIITKARERKSEINILKDQENYRREFLGNISHELKTPLFTIQGYILTLIEGAMKDKKVREKYLKRAAKGVDRLISIVKDLDLITQFESGIKTVDKTDFNIYELVENVFELLEFESEKNNIKLQYENENITPIYVYADQERVLQVLTNLVVNSIKYGSNNGYTKVVVEDFNKDKVIIKVIDDGEGIEKKHLPRLFERFYRIDKNRSRKKGGSGLGLSIVKHIIEAHKEQIFVKSEIGKGTEFSFTLTKPKFWIIFMSKTDFFSKVYKVVKTIPSGKVSTYGLIANKLGTGQSARTVGWALNACHNDSSIPAHRVVNRNGILTGKHHFKGFELMKQLLENEGVKVDDDRVVDFKSKLWKP